MFIHYQLFKVFIIALTTEVTSAVSVQAIAALGEANV